MLAWNMKIVRLRNGWSIRQYQREEGPPSLSACDRAVSLGEDTLDCNEGYDHGGYKK